ncbi:lipopolysaccharide heptosyltransferase II [bacterium]|nr:lipopolysaccharide heptosyltransferase II [bacterium]
MNGSATQKRALVINTAFIGDVVLTVPLFSLLAENGWTVDALVIPRAAGLLDGHPHLNRVIVYDKHREPGLGKLLSLGRELRGRYDAAIVPHPSARSAILARLTRTPVRIGYQPPKKPYSHPFTNRKLRPRFTFWRFLYTHLVEYGLSRQEGLRICDLGAALGLGYKSAPIGTLAVTEPDSRCIENRLGGISRPLVVLFPGSVWASKRYPEASYIEVGRRLVKEGRVGIVVCGSAEEEGVCAKVTTGIPGALGLIDLTLGELKALIKVGELVVTNDSAPLHLAAVLGTPVVAVYGPTTPVLGFRPPEGHPQRLVFHRRLECQPCRLSPPKACPLGHHRCMLDLDPELVIEACHDLLGEVGL